MYKLIFIVYSVIFSVHTLASYSISGTVRDANTGELLIGANVYLKNHRKSGTSTGFDGSFVLNGIQNGKATIVCSYISYQTLEKEVYVRPGIVVQLSLVSSDNMLDDLVVLSNIRGSDAFVRNMERLSSSVMNVVGARSIEISPDLSVANILQRVSGVVMERNSSGEGQYAILRGMDKRYNTTLVNGVKIASPDNKQRFIPLDIFPGELLDRLEVNKTQTADNEGDATGGSINMVMKDAPTQFEMRLNAAMGYNEMFLSNQFVTYDYSRIVRKAPYEEYGKDYEAKIADMETKVKALRFLTPKPNMIAGMSLGNRLFNNKMGWIIAANYQHQYKGSEGFLFSDFMNQNASTLSVDKYEQRKFHEEQLQFGLHVKLDYRLHANHRFTWYNAYIDVRNASYRSVFSTNLSLNYHPPTNLNQSFQTRLRLTEQQIFASTLQGKHKFNTLFDVQWSAVLSSAIFQRPAQVYIKLDNSRADGVDNIYVDPDGNVKRWEHNSDLDLSGIVHVNYTKPLEIGLLTLQTGALYRTKIRDNFWIEYQLKPENLSQQMGVDFETKQDIHQISWYVGNPRGSMGPLYYEARENIGATYIQAKIETGQLELVSGLRHEYTDQGYFLQIKSLVHDQVGGHKYHDFMPNMHLRYSPEINKNWRLSYFRSINRPGFFEIVPYMVMNEDYTEYGNPELKRAKIDNIDLRWELFPKPTEQIMVGAFYKHIASPIEFAYFSRNDRQFGYGPRNLGNANNLGIEVDFIKFIREIGFKANYTYTYSAIKTPKVYYAVNDRGRTEKQFRNQVRPMVGQAGHVANLSLLYKNIKKKMDAQLALSYTGEKMVVASHFLNSDYWQKSMLHLDFSAEKRIGNGLSVYVKANNLLNTPVIEFVKTHNPFNDDFPHQSASSGETIIRKNHFKRSVLAGFRFVF